MSKLRTLVLALVVSTCATVLWAGALPGGGERGWGPSWVGGGPPGGNIRPTKFDAPITHSIVFDDQSRLGLGVRFWCDGEVTPGNQYQLLCQFRVHTKKGEEGPLLGTTAQPAGTTFLVASGTANAQWNGLEGTIDITRKDLATMTNLPKGKTTTLRIEPQLYDQTTQKYVTPVKTSAIIVMVEVEENGRVDSVLSLANWISQNGQYNSDKVLDALADLDVYDAEGNGVAEALGNVLSYKEIDPAIKLKYVRAISKDWVYLKHPMLWQSLTTLSKSDNKELSAAAEALLKQ